MIASVTDCCQPTLADEPPRSPRSKLATPTRPQPHQRRRQHVEQVAVVRHFFRAGSCHAQIHFVFSIAHRHVDSAAIVHVATASDPMRARNGVTNLGGASAIRHSRGSPYERPAGHQPRRNAISLSAEQAHVLATKLNTISAPPAMLSAKCPIENYHDVSTAP